MCLSHLAILSQMYSYVNSNNSFNNANIGLQGTDFQDRDKLVPDSIRFKTVKSAVAARRVPVKIRAEQQQYSSSSNKLMRIILPNNAIYDTRSSYLTFDLTITTTGGTYKRLATAVFSAINRLRVLAGATEIEDLRDWNRIYNILWEMINPPDVTANMGTTVMGFGTQFERNLLGSQVTSYACPIYSGVFNTELLPFQNLKNQIVLELYIDDPTTFVETDGTNPQITISNLVFNMERLELDKSYSDYIMSYVSTHGLKLGFHTWERYINALTTGVNQNISITQRSSSMNGMLNIFTNSATINDPTTNDKYLNWLPLTISTVQAFINGSVYPDEPIDCVYASAFQAFQIYLRWVQKYNANGLNPIAAPLTNFAFTSNRFVQVDDFEAFPELDDVINPFNTLISTSPIIKKLVFSSLIPANYQLDSWIEFFKLICIYADGSIAVKQ